MADFSATQIPKPKNWQDFERQCRVLFACELGDPNTQLNGRGGQQQNGVDIIGKRLKHGGHWVGIQCKGKDAGFGTALTEQELRSEAAKAQKFQPALREFIIATTAPVDQAIQAAARIISDELKAKGVELEIHVYGWGELEERISSYPDALKTFHPDASPFSDNIIGNQEALLTKQDAISDKIDGFSTSLANNNSTILTQLENIIERKSRASVEASTRDGEIDRALALIEDGEMTAALKLLQNLWSDLGEAGTPRTRYRVKANIGFVHSCLGNAKLAADCLIEAYGLNPTAHNAKTNLAAAYLLQDNLEACIRTAEEVLEDNPPDENAASYLIQARQRFSPVQDPLSLVPEEVRAHPTVCAAAVFGMRLIENMQWVEAATEWHEAHPENRWLARMAAEAVIDKASRSPAFVVGATGEPSAEALSAAVETLRKELAEASRSNPQNLDPALSNNLAEGLRALSRHEEALGVVREAINQGANQSYLNRLAAVLSARIESVGAALEYLKDADLTDPDNIILKAELLQTKDPKTALELLQSHDFTDAPRGKAHMARELEIECLALLQSNTEELDAQLEQLETDFPDLGTPLGLKVRLIRRRKPADQLEAAEQLAANITQETSFPDRFQACELLEDLGQFDRTADLLEGFVALDRRSPALWLYLRVLANSHRKRLAHDVVASLSEDIRNSPRCLDIQAVIAHKAGDLKEAIRCYEEYIKLRPDSLHARLRWAAVSLNVGEDAAVREWIKQDVESLNGHPGDQANLAHLLDYLGETDRALALAYKLARLHPRTAATQRVFSTLMLFRTKDPTDKDKLLESDTIRPDTTFQISNGIGEQLWFRIERDTSLCLIANDKTPDDVLSIAVKGLKVGDSFQFPRMEDRTKNALWTVDEIKHKYVGLLHEIIPHGEERYGPDFGLQRFHVDPEDPNSFEPIFKMMRERYHQIQRALDEYQSKKFPLRFISRVLGGEVFPIYESIILERRPFHSCIGTLAERQMARRAILENSCNGCIVDSITLALIRRLDIKDALEAVCGQIYVTQSCVNEFQRDLGRLTAGGVREQRSTHFDGEHYILHENSLEEVRSEVDRRSKTVDWVQRFPIVEAIGSKDPAGSTRLILNEFDPEFLDDALAAEGKGLLLVSEDLGYRQIASLERNVNATWLQPILMLAVEDGVLSPERYSEIVIRLCKAGHNFTSMSAFDLTYAAENDSEGFEALAITLTATQVETLSQLRVSIEFFQRIWSSRPRELSTSAQTGKLLTGLFHVRSENWAPMVKIFLHGRRLPSAFKDYLHGWLRGHFLVPR